MITPANDWFAEFTGGEIVPLVAWRQSNTGEAVVGLVAVDDETMPATESEDFVRYVHDSDLPEATPGFLVRVWRGFFGSN